MSSVFEPESVEAMGIAFEMAVAKLAARDAESREALAFKIVAAARAGDCDPYRLCEKAIASDHLVA
jgi:hypothetical protein